MKSLKKSVARTINLKKKSDPKFSSDLKILCDALTVLQEQKKNNVFIQVLGCVPSYALDILRSFVSFNRTRVLGQDVYRKFKSLSKHSVRSSSEDIHKVLFKLVNLGLLNAHFEYHIKGIYKGRVNFNGISYHGATMPDMEKDFRSVQEGLAAGKLFWKDGVVYETNGNKKSPKLFSSFTMNPWLKVSLKDVTYPKYELAAPEGAMFWEEICLPLLSALYTPEVLFECSRRASIEFSEISFDLKKKLKLEEELHESNPVLWERIKASKFGSRQVKSRYESLLLDDSINSWRPVFYAHLTSLLESDPSYLKTFLNSDWIQVPANTVVRNPQQKFLVGTIHVPLDARTSLGKQWKRLYPEG